MPGEGKAAGEEHGGSGFVPGAVFVVAHQGEAPAGKLHPDLMAAAGVKADANQVFTLADEFQPGLFTPFRSFFTTKTLFLLLSLNKKSVQSPLSGGLP